MLGNKTLCLSMIVRDEAHVIARCLTSVLGVIDSWVIADTGSTDGTQDIVRETLAGIPGELREDRWHDFATNRNLALVGALRRADYVLILDADEVLERADWFVCPSLDADSYLVEMRLGHATFVARRLLKASLPWSWVGVLHEYPDCAAATRNVRLHGLTIRARSEGARSRDPEKFAKDAAVLRAAIAEEPANDRYRFYLGQTLRDGGLYAEAISAYEEHLALAEGWAEERWYSALAIAWCMDRLDYPWPAVAERYLAAWAAKPERAEPLYYLAMRALEQDRLALADLYLARAHACPIPLHAPLFVDMALYLFVIPMEYSFTCFKSGRYGEALAIVARLLSSGLELPAEAREALLENQQALRTAMLPREK